MSENKTAAKSVNDLLQMDFFETTTSKTPENKLFDKSRFISDDSIIQTGYTSISYKIELNNPGMLSIIFEVEGMGAYPTYYQRYFSFNSKKGTILTPDNIFTPEGINAIQKIVIEKRSDEIKKWIQELKVNNEATYAEDSSFITERFAKCNSEAHESNMFIEKGKILFYKDDCFPHAWGPYEANLDIEFTYKELEKYLSGFGKSLLFTK